VIAEFAGNQVFARNRVVLGARNRLVGAGAAGVEGFVKGSVGFEPYNPARGLAIEAAEVAIDQQFALLTARLVQDGGGGTVAGFHSFSGGCVESVGLVETAIGVQPGDLADFDTVQNHAIPCLEPVRLVVPTADVVAE